MSTVLRASGWVTDRRLPSHREIPVHTGYDSSSTQLSGTCEAQSQALLRMPSSERWAEESGQFVWSSPQRRLLSPSLHLFQEQRVFIGWLGKGGCTEVTADTLGSVSRSSAVGIGLKFKKSKKS